MLISRLDGLQRESSNGATRGIDVIDREDDEVVALELIAEVVQRDVALGGERGAKLEDAACLLVDDEPMAPGEFFFSLPGEKPAFAKLASVTEKHVGPDVPHGQLSGIRRVNHARELNTRGKLWRVYRCLDGSTPGNKPRHVLAAAFRSISVDGVGSNPMRLNCFLLASSLLIVACKSTAADATSDAQASVPSGKRLVDETLLRAQCLQSAIEQPPKASGRWAEVGVLEAGTTKFGWIVVEQTDADVPLQNAQSYGVNVPLMLMNVAMNTSPLLCGPVWSDARAHTLLTALVRVGGDSSRGTFVAVGAKADQQEGRPVIFKDVSLVEARRAAVRLLHEAIGMKLRCTSCSLQWMEAADEASR